MESKKKALTPKEIFCGMPRLREYFRRLDDTIKRFDPSEGSSEEVEKLKKRRKDLLLIAKDLDSTDLQTLYYLHSLKRISALHFLHALKKLYTAQEELLALVNPQIASSK